MQTLVELLIELKDLATGNGDDKLARINKIFSDPRAPAEFAVARHMVARLLTREVDAQLDSLDARRRRDAIATARLVFPRTAAARVLRRVYNDADPSVRTSARRAIERLGLDVVPPYGTRVAYEESRAFSDSWAYGIFPSTPRRRRPRPPARPTALDAHGLPRLATRADVAKLVGVEEEALTRLMRPGTGPGSGYVEFEIPKAKGGTRRIAAPRPELRRVQRALLEQILAKVPLHDACHGFVAGRSTVSNATPHRGAKLVVKLDLKDFFPTVHYRRVRGLFQQLGYGDDVAAALAGLTCYRPRMEDGTIVWPGMLPQGAPTSPALANLACRRLDARLAKLAAKYGATYTRYADDLTFSFQAEPEVRIGRFLWWVDAICQEEGFLERPDKRRILRAKHQQRVTGLVVNASVHVPRADRRRFRAIVHNCEKHGIASQARGREDFEAYLAGYAAYLHMVDPAGAKPLVDAVEKLTRG
jgi:hypothetical protein